ncbi:MAG: transporter substrate-binding domain-containing protein [Pseudomonadota bacterium]
MTLKNAGLSAGAVMLVSQLLRNDGSTGLIGTPIVNIKLSVIDSFRTACAGLLWYGVLVLTCLLPQVPALAAQTDTMAVIRDRGHLVCGGANDEIGLSSVTSGGNWTGIYSDLCRALAIAIFDDPKAVRFVPLAGTQRFRALADGQIDILARNSARTASRELREDVSFAGAFFYDGKRFLIRKSSGILSALELSGADACLIAGSLTEASVAHYFSKRGMKFHPKTSETWTEALENYKKQTCLVLAADTVQLSLLRSSLEDKEDHSLLPEMFDVDAFGPYVPGQDPRWRKAVRWIIDALVLAEEHGITQENVVKLNRSSQNASGTMLGIAEAAGKQLGFVEGWFQKLIQKVGNYGEVFERNLGRGSSIGLARGPNRPASMGGSLQVPALR